MRYTFTETLTRLRYGVHDANFGGVVATVVDRAAAHSLSELLQLYPGLTIGQALDEVLLHEKSRDR